MLADDLDEWLSATEAEQPEQIPEVFTEFCSWLGLTLEPGQSAIAKVAFDGMNPEDLEGEEKRLAYEVFGGVDRIPPEARRVFVGVCGARGGKTYVLTAMRSLHRAVTGKIPSKLPPGQKPACVIVAPDLTLAGEVMDYIRGAVENNDVLAPMIDRNVTQEIALKRPDWTVRIACLAATAGGKASRGRWLLNFAMDEAAFFRDSSYKVNDSAIFKPALARLPVGGQVEINSTPYAEAGLLYEKYTENFGNPKTAMVAQAPTLVLRDTPDTRNAVEASYNNDPIDAERECGAKFLSIGTSMLFDGRAILESVNRGKAHKFPRRPSENGVVEAGGDFGFRTNSSAIAAVELMPGNKYQCLFIGEETPAAGVLKPSVIVKSFASIMKKVGIEVLVADRHHRESIEEHLENNGVFYRPAPKSADAFMLLDSLMREGRVDLPDHPKLIKQIREVTKRPLPGGGVSVDSPVWRSGEHGDLAIAFALAVWAAHQHEVPEERVEYVKHSAEWWTQLEEDRFNATIEKRQREMSDEQENTWILGP